MLQVGLTSLFFLVVIAIILYVNNGSRRKEEKTRIRKSRVFNTKLDLLEILCRDMAKITSQLGVAAGSLNRDVELMRSYLRTAAAESGNGASKRSMIEPSAKQAEVDGLLKVANRVFDDMNVMLSIWNGEFKRSESSFDVYELIKGAIKDFRTYLDHERPAVRIQFTGDGRLLCASDPRHVSRCVRAILSQALKQTESGTVEVKVVVAAGVLRQKSDITIVVTDASKRMPEAADKYEIDPDRARRNPFLREDPSAILRLNLARQTAQQLGGHMRFRPLKDGNMMFVFTFQGIILEVEEH